MKMTNEEIIYNGNDQSVSRSGVTIQAINHSSICNDVKADNGEGYYQ